MAKKYSDQELQNMSVKELQSLKNDLSRKKMQRDGTTALKSINNIHKGGRDEPLDLCYPDQVQTVYGYSCGGSESECSEYCGGSTMGCDYCCDANPNDPACYNDEAQAWCHDTCGGHIDQTYHNGCADGEFPYCSEGGTAWGTWVDPPNHSEDDYTCHIWTYCTCDGVTCDNGWCVESQAFCPHSCTEYYQIYDDINWDSEWDEPPEFGGFVDDYCGGDPLNCFDSFFKHLIKCYIEDFNINDYLQEYAGSDWKPMWDGSGMTDAYVVYDEGGNQVGVDSIEVGIPTVSFNTIDSADDPIIVNIDIAPLRANMIIHVGDIITLDEVWVGTVYDTPFMIELTFTPVYTEYGILNDYNLNVDANFWFFMFNSGLVEEMCDCYLTWWDTCNWIGDFTCCTGCLLAGSAALIQLVASLITNYFTGDLFALIIKEVLGPDGINLDLKLAPVFMAIMHNFCPVGLGDLSGDGFLNVLDIVILANCLLVGNCDDEPNGACGDLNDDGIFNVLDIVILANCILDPNCGDGRASPPEGMSPKDHEIMIMEILGIAQDAESRGDLESPQALNQILDVAKRKGIY